MSSKEDTGRGILLFSNRKYLFALGTFLINLQNYVSYDGVIVYHDDLSMDEQNAIRKIEPKVRFIKYGLDTFAKEFGFNEEELKSIQFIQIYSVLAVSKFKIFKHLNEYTTVFMFDLDMLLLDRIDELLVNEYDIAWRTDVGQTIQYKLNRGGVSDEFIKKLGMYDVYKNVETPNAGFFVVKRTFDYKKTYEECVDYLRNYGFLHPVSIDEILFGYIASKMKLRVYSVDEVIYDVFPDRVNINSKLIHFLGGYKPWSNQLVQAMFIDWRKCYEKFLTLTNMPSKEVIDFGNISECLIQDTCRHTWKDLFGKEHFIYPKELKMMPEVSPYSLNFSYYGFAMYRIETDWGGFMCSCVFILPKNENMEVTYWQEKLQKLASNNNDFLIYQEDEKSLGLKTYDRNLREIPDVFYQLYELTREICMSANMRIIKISTFHGTKMYVDVEKCFLMHKNGQMDTEVFVAARGSKCYLYINLFGKNVYLNKIEDDGRVVLSDEQNAFSLIYNDDQSISIEVKDGYILSADMGETVALKHWNREWEHFFVQTVGTITE